MKTSVPLLDPSRTTRTRFTIRRHERLRLQKIGVSVCALRIILVARETCVPGYLMGETHFEVAFVAADVGIWMVSVLVVDLAAIAVGVEAGAEVGFVG